KEHSQCRPAAVPVEEPVLVSLSEILLQRGGRAAENLVVGLFEHQRRAACKQLTEHPLFGCAYLFCASDAIEHFVASIIAQSQITIGTEIDDRRGEAALIERHVADVAHGSSRHSIRRTEQRDDRSRRWIAADTPPGEPVIGADDQQAQYAG